MDDARSMNLERGFRRLTWVISLGLASVWLVVLLSDPYSGSWREVAWLELFSVMMVFAAIPWGVFFVARWIAYGFNDKPERRAPPSEPPVPKEPPQA